MLESLQLEFGRRRMPSLLQSEAAECGLACLAMVSTHHGYRTDLSALRARFGLSLKGITLDHLMQFAEGLNLIGRPLRLEVEEIPQLKMPCILHWQMNHFVVLSSASTRGVIVHDPAVGIRELGWSEVETAFTGVALELTPGFNFEPTDERQRVSVSALVGNVTGLWRGLGLVFLMALALQVFALAAPLFNQWVLDEALVAGDRDMLNVLAIASLLLMVTQTSIEQARGWSLMYLSTHMGLQWNANVFTHLLRLPMTWFEKRHLGDVVSRFGAVGAIQNQVTTGFIAAFLDGFMATATLIMMFLYSPTLTMVVIASVALYALLRVVAYRPLREASREALALKAQEQSCFLESIRAIQAIKLAGRELDRRSRWLNLMTEAVNRGIRVQKLGLLFGNLHVAVAGIASVLVFRLGSGMVMDTTFTVGMLIAFSSYSAQFAARMGALINNAIEFRMLSMHAERLADIVLEPAETDGDKGASLDHLQARIELVDVGFRYAELEPWVLRHVNLVIEPGESVAFAGASGCGKTTLTKLILGTLQPTEGEIRYGGVPIRHLGPCAYRSVLAAVMQDDHLLAGSLRDNISFFDQRADEQRIEQCARMASIHADIAKMPMGYESLAGDMGTALSGGQKQRILLARALYKEPKVLVLDEATSHLDLQLEYAVNQAVAALKFTRIIVAHRRETLASARRMVVLAGGMVVQDLTTPFREPEDGVASSD